jgi:uncharacterized membrane protein YhhN
MLRHLPWLAALCALAAIASAPWALNQPWLNHSFKPLTTALLIAWAWPRGLGSPQRPWLLAGLAWSWLGDVALMWPQQGFLPGLVSFLLAHLCYLVAFRRGGTPWLAWPAGALACAVLAGGVLSFLWSGVPAPLRGPVVVYVLALATMAAQAAGQWHRRRGTAAAGLAGRAALGGALFMLSDSLLATDRFAQPLPAASLWVLSSYWLAQGLIAGSMAPPAPKTTQT